MKPRALLIRSVWFLVLFFCAPTIAIVGWSASAAAQETPPAPAMPATLTTATAVVYVLALVLGIVNQVVQSGKVANTWTVPAKALPYFVMIGSFVGGVYAYDSSLPQGFAFTGTVIFYSVGAGIAALLVGASPGIVVHHFGGQVNAMRPPPDSPASPPSARKVPTVPPIVGPAILSLTIVLSCLVGYGSAGCKDLSPKLPSDLQPVEACVTADFQKGVTDPAQYLADCAATGEVSLIEAVWDEIAFLLDSKQVPAQQSVALSLAVQEHRAQLAAGKHAAPASSGP